MYLFCGTLHKKLTPFVEHEVFHERICCTTANMLIFNEHVLGRTCEITICVGQNGQILLLTYGQQNINFQARKS